MDELNNRQTFIFVYMSMYLEYICVVIPIWIFKTIFWRQNYTVFLLNTPWLRITRYFLVGEVFRLQLRCKNFLSFFIFDGICYHNPSSIKTKPWTNSTERSKQTVLDLRGPCVPIRTPRFIKSFCSANQSKAIENNQKAHVSDTYRKNTGHSRDNQVTTYGLPAILK